MTLYSPLWDEHRPVLEWPMTMLGRNILLLEYLRTSVSALPLALLVPIEETVSRLPVGIFQDDALLATSDVRRAHVIEGRDCRDISEDPLQRRRSRHVCAQESLPVFIAEREEGRRVDDLDRPVLGHPGNELWGPGKRVGQVRQIRW